MAGAPKLTGIEKEVEQWVEEAHQFAENSPTPPRESAAEHVFADATPKPLARSTGGAKSSSPERVITFMKATLEGLSEEFARNPKIFVLGEGIGQRGGNFATT